MKTQVHPVAGAVMLVLTLIPALADPSALSGVFVLILCGLALRYGFWGAIWRWFLVCTIIFIPLVLMAGTQLPADQRRRRHIYY